MIIYEPGIRFDAQIPRKKGTFIFPARIARTGKHFYGDGERFGMKAGYEERDEEELKRIISQLEGTPVVVTHPKGLLKEGAKAKIVGRAIKGWQDGDHAAGNIRIDEQEGLKAIDDGYRELSLGYAAKNVNGFQRETEVDHIALVRASRCGSTCSVRTDSLMCSCSCQSHMPRKEIVIANQILASQFARVKG